MHIDHLVYDGGFLPTTQTELKFTQGITCEARYCDALHCRLLESFTAPCFEPNIPIFFHLLALFIYLIHAGIKLKTFKN